MPGTSSTNPDFDFEAVFEVNDYLYFYSEDLTPERTEAEVDFMVRELELDQPLDILDLACGFGRHTNRLAAREHRITGVDLTPGFIEIARREAEAQGLTVDYQVGDMRRLDSTAVFDRVLLVFTAFGYFSDEENLLVLRNVARALKPGGLFLLDIQNRDTMMKIMLPYIVTEKEGNLMIDLHQFDSLTGRMYNHRIVIRDGQRRDKPFVVRLYTATEIKSLLQSVGLQIVKIYGGWDSRPVSTDGKRLVIIARKEEFS